MGKLRARSQAELDQRYTDILNAASELFMDNNYEDLSLTSIAKSIGLSRPALYSYFHSKEALFLELSKREYITVAKEMQVKFTKPIGLEDFCANLVAIFLHHRLFLKLLALHQTVMEAKVGIAQMKEFKTSTVPFFRTMFIITKQEFPRAATEQLYHFIEQVNVLLPTINNYISIPQEQATVMRELKIFGGAPLLDAKIFYTNMLKSIAQPLV